MTSQTGISRLSETVRARLLRSDVDLTQVAHHPRSIHRRPASFPARWQRVKQKTRFVVGVSTFNRVDYVRRFIETFEETRGDEFEWILIVADDGSSDGTVDYLLNLSIPGVLVIKIFNKGARIAGQTNSILLAAEAVDHDFGIMCDDDIYFVEEGWAKGYFEASRSGGFDHLVFHDESWKTGDFEKVDGSLVSRVRAENAMGCLWTFTPRLVNEVGYFDERSFPVRGHSHLDYTFRASRLGHNDIAGLWDWSKSTSFIRMWPKDDYLQTVDWGSTEVKSALSEEQRRHRQGVVETPDRKFMPFDPLPTRQFPIVESTERDPSLLAALVVRGFSLRARGQLALYDEAFVLNLPHQRSNWKATATALATAGISFRRSETVNGYQTEVRSAWERYAATGLDHPHEQRIGRKLIQSPGAWGYLSSAEAVIESARKSRYHRVLMFDDDVLLVRDFDERLEAILAELSEEWVLLYLGASYDDAQRLHRLTPQLVDPGDRVNGSFAVAFGAECYDLLSAGIEERLWPFDSGPLREVRRRYPDRVFAARPELVLPDVSVSAIRGSRDQAAFAEQMGWTLEDFERHSEPPEPQVSIVLWAGSDAVALRETLRSLRFQLYGWFEVLVVVSPDWPESLEAATEARSQDPRVTVLSVDTTDSITGLGAVGSLAPGSARIHALAGDIFFPDHLSLLISQRFSADVIVPLAIPTPRGGRVSGQLGSSWESLRDSLIQEYGYEPRSTRALFSSGARERIGDLPAWDELRVSAMSERGLDGTPLTMAVPSMIAVGPPYSSVSGAPASETPFFISAGRSMPATLVQE